MVAKVANVKEIEKIPKCNSVFLLSLLPSSKKCMWTKGSKFCKSKEEEGSKSSNLI